MLTLYEYPQSGNSYKCRLLLEQLNIPHERIYLDIIKGAARTEEFRKINPNQKIPTLVLDDGRALWESNAILWYLAEGTDFLSDDKWLRAKTLQWMSFEQYYIEANIAVARFQIQYNNKSPEDVKDKIKDGHRALGILNEALEGRQFIVNDCYSIADIALFGYTHMAEDGDVSLKNYPNIRSWIDRIKATPGFVKVGAP